MVVAHGPAERPARAGVDVYSVVERQPHRLDVAGLAGGEEGVLQAGGHAGEAAAGRAGSSSRESGGYMVLCCTASQGRPPPGLQ